MKAKWMLSIRTYHKRRDFIFKRRDDETDLQCYQRAKAEMNKLKEKYTGQSVTVELISRNQAFKPPVNYKNPKGHLWCPYCIKPRVFVHDEYRDIDKCCVCGMSTMDFYIKKYNNLWTLEYIQYRANGGDL